MPNLPGKPGLPKPTPPKPPGKNFPKPPPTQKKKKMVDYGYTQVPQGDPFDKRQKAFLKKMQEMNRRFGND